MIISFLYPYYLSLLIIMPIILIIHVISIGNRKKTALKFANFDAIAKIEGIDFFSKNIVTLFLSVFIILLLVLAVSGLTFHTFKEATAFSFVIAMDSSQSMEADDLFPNRMTVSKQTAVEFVEIMPFGTNIGVISFAGSSYIEQDLTTDKTLLTKAINDLELTSFGGTDLYEAVITSTNLLIDEDDKAIILLSDGQINVRNINDTIDYANKHDVIVHSIAVGTKEGGMTEYAISKLDEDSLKSIAYETGGDYFSAEDKETLSQSFLDISKLTRKKVSIELKNYLIILAIILFVIEFILVNTKYLSLP